MPPLHDPPVPRMPAPGAVTVVPLTGVPEVRSGDDLASMLLTALARAGQSLGAGDCVVVSSKVVSKALGLVVDRPPGAVVDAVTQRVVAERRGPGGVTRIVEATAGPVMAAGGVDASNTGPAGTVLVLPEDPDAEAARLREELVAAIPGPGGAGAALAVVLSDTAGRPWRAGQTDFALGSAGFVVLDDLRGGVDADGRPLAVTARALADEVASAADLVKGKADGVPAALVRGLPRAWFAADADGARTLVRTGPTDWFALGHVEAVRAALGVEPGTDVAGEVGVPATTPEALGERVGRVVTLALLDVPDGSADVALEGGSAELTLAAPDPYDLGRLVTRTVVAAASESLTCEVGDRGPASVALTLTPR